MAVDTICCKRPVVGGARGRRRGGGAQRAGGGGEGVRSRVSMAPNLPPPLPSLRLIELPK